MLVGLMVAAVPAACGGGSIDGLSGAAGSRGAGGSVGTGSGGASAAGGSSVAGQSGTGGSTASGACGQVEPCGGPVDGVWNASSGCLNNAAFMLEVTKGLPAGCGLVAVSSSSDSAVGSLSFSQATLTYSSDVTETVNIQFTIPMTCINGQTCAQYGTSLAQQGGATSATCVGTTTCACDFTAQNVMNESGTFSTSGTTLTLTNTLGSQTSGPYCVQGTSLHLIDVDTTTNLGPNGQATIDDDTVFIKQ
ncbi:MAG TPA: hypothetical protein VGP64_01815 [Polyangia bacterium]